jgi:hypothetical protein
MIRLPILFLLLFTSVCGAQPRLTREYHAIHDSCPDPLKNHIRQRTIYTRCADAGWCQEDTMVEKFDRRGRLISIERHTTDSYGRRLLLHYFTYDSLGRTVRDTGIYDEKTAFFAEGYLVEYEYPDLYTAIERVSFLGKKIVITRHYNKQYELTDLLSIQNGKDTLQRMYKRGDTTITLTWVNTLFDDSTITIKTKDSFYTYSSKADRGNWQPCATLIRYDANGRMAYKLHYYQGKVLADSIVPTCNATNQLVKETWYGYSSNGESFHRYNIAYTYRNNLLVAQREWQESGDVFESRRLYTYNRKGLRTKYELYWTSPAMKDKLQLTEVWEYEYW